MEKMFFGMLDNRGANFWSLHLKSKITPASNVSTTASLAANLEFLSNALVAAAAALQDHLQLEVFDGMKLSSDAPGVAATFKQWQATAAFHIDVRQLHDKFFTTMQTPTALLAAPVAKAVKKVVVKAVKAAKAAAPTKAAAKGAAIAKPANAAKAAAAPQVVKGPKAAKALAVKAVAPKKVRVVVRKSPEERAEALKKFFAQIKPKLNVAEFVPVNIAAAVREVGLSEKSSAHFVAALVKEGLVERQGPSEYKLTTKGAEA